MPIALQVVCFFDWRKNTVMTGGSGELDERLDHVLRSLRQENHFRGEELESLLVRPKSGQVAPERLLLMGLGDPDTLTAGTFVRVGRMAVLEAIRLEVLTLALAPDIRDAGVAYPGRAVSSALVTGMIQALKTAATLYDLGITERPKLAEIALLAGHDHISMAEDGLRDAMNQEKALSDRASVP
jgi:hypothetical protein